MTRPGGHVFISTINRNLKSFVLAIVGAEYNAGIVLINGSATPNTVSNDDGDAVCTIALSLDTLNRLILRELEPTTAFMMGKIKVSGDMSVAMKLQHLL